MRKKYEIMNKNRNVGIVYLSDNNVFTIDNIAGNLPYGFTDIAK